MARYVFILLFLMTLFFGASAHTTLDETHISSSPIKTVTEFVQETETVENDASDLTLFFGRFHPFLVHLPIGFLLFAFLLEFASLFKRFEQLKHAVPFALLIGFLTAMMAGFTGFLLSTGGGYGEDILSAHRLLGTSVVVLSFLAFLLRITLYEDPFYRRVFRVTLVATAAVVIATGHFGGSLTHGSDYLFRYMPEPLRSITGTQLNEEAEIALIENLDSALVYHNVIEPIIRTRCQNCHNPDRREGELLLTTYDRLMEGGESGPIIVTNQAEQSELYKRLTLPSSDDNHMPPEGRRQLTPDQIKLIAWWIDLGVPFDKKISELETQGDISDILQNLTVAGQSFFERTEIPEADDQIVDIAKEHGFQISRISEDLNFLQAGVSKSVKSINIEDLDLLLPISQQITWLDLGRIHITDSDLTNLSEFKNLTRLSLQHTDIGDSTLQIISTLENLEYLNVYATQITDAGLEHLKKLKNLQSLYLWQTNVSSEAAESLQNQMSGLYINIGENEHVVAD